MARLLLVVAAALILCGIASAATIDDLRALGYSVQQSAPGTPGCPTYYISGHGVGSYFSGCDQATIDAYYNPTAICNADWQMNHSDQYGAYRGISAKGWSVSGDQCADTYNVTNPNDNTTAYSGGGAGLVGFNDNHGSPAAAQVTPGQPAPVTAPPQNCLPLCPNPGDARGAGGVLMPATSTGAVATTIAFAPNASFVYDAVTGDVASTHIMLRVGSAVAV